MLCLTCSIDMELTQSDKDTSASVERCRHRTWRCGVKEVHRAFSGSACVSELYSLLDLATDANVQRLIQHDQKSFGIFISPGRTTTNR